MSKEKGLTIYYSGATNFPRKAPASATNLMMTFYSMRAKGPDAMFKAIEARRRKKVKRK
jgi:hypothetical protein